MHQIRHKYISDFLIRSRRFGMTTLIVWIRKNIHMRLVVVLNLRNNAVGPSSRHILTNTVFKVCPRRLPSPPPSCAAYVHSSTEENQVGSAGARNLHRKSAFNQILLAYSRRKRKNTNISKEEQKQGLQYRLHL